jgi:hypothetical protein
VQGTPLLYGFTLVLVLPLLPPETVPHVPQLSPQVPLVVLKTLVICLLIARKVVTNVQVTVTHHQAAVEI